MTDAGSRRSLLTSPIQTKIKVMFLNHKRIDI